MPKLRLDSGPVYETDQQIIEHIEKIEEELTTLNSLYDDLVGENARLRELLDRFMSTATPFCGLSWAGLAAHPHFDKVGLLSKLAKDTQAALAGGDSK